MEGSDLERQNRNVLTWSGEVRSAEAEKNWNGKRWLGGVGKDGADGDRSRGNGQRRHRMGSDGQMGNGEE